MVGLAGAGIVLVLVVVAGAGVLRAIAPDRSEAPPGGPAVPHFVEEALTAGLEHRYDGEFEYFVGGGVAVMDCDLDGRPDLYLAGGAGAAGLYRNESEPGGPLRLARVDAAATDLDAVTGAYPLDVDGDEIVDLAVLRFGENVLLRGLGDCRFERANDALGLAGGDAWTAAFSATWEGSATLPTLAFANYAELDEAGRWTGACVPNALVRPAVAAARYDAPVSLTPGWCSLSLLFSDWSRTGRRDLRVSNDRHYYSETSAGEEQLWRVEAGRPPRLYTRDEGWQTVRVWGMGIASHDLTGDGLPEVYLTSQGDNKLQALTEGPARPHYADIAIRRGVTAHRPYAGDVTMPSTAWHAEFQDVNNDTFADLFVSKGNVEAMPDYAARDPSNLLLGGADGLFAEAAESAGIVSFARARGAALADLNLDGLLDLVVVNRRENVSLWRNVGSGDAARPAPMGNWVAIRLRQLRPNVDAVGAWVEVRVGERTQTREVTVGGGHAGGQLGWLHFGLGHAVRAEVRVQWPDSEVGPWQAMEAGGRGIVERGAAEIRPWTPPS